MERILIIDDEELNRTATEMTLKRAGYRVLTAESGEAGLEILKERKFDLLLLDIDMPQMSGLETLEIIRKTPRIANLKVVFLTASGFREDVTEAIRLGALDFLRKPCTPATMIERVQHALARAEKDTVMIVDDEMINLKAVKCIFDIRYHVITAESGEQALELLKTNRVDLFLLDLHMPDMDGLELYDHIRDIPWAEELPVVFLTGDTEPETEIRIFRAGAMDYLRKPVIAQVALQRINRILELKHMQDSMRDELDEMYRRFVETGKSAWRRKSDRIESGQKEAAQDEPVDDDELMEILSAYLPKSPEFSEHQGYEADWDDPSDQKDTIDRTEQEEKEEELTVGERRKKLLENDEEAQLKQQFIETVLAVLEEKDPVTCGHSRRVAKYSEELARRMGKTESEILEIYNAALLHDIGKIGLPRKILEKQDRLTGDEYLIYQNHTGIGANILEHLSRYPLYTAAAHWHHERFDGLGYPDGLLGGNIPEVARIIGVADSYDMMTSSQGYRGALPQAMVRSEFEKDESRHYDPRIVRHMIQMIDEDRNYEMREFL